MISNKSELDLILDMHEKYGKINLLCWCKPKSCHGDFIKKYLEKRLLESLD